MTYIVQTQVTKTVSWYNEGITPLCHIDTFRLFQTSCTVDGQHACLQWMAPVKYRLQLIIFSSATWCTQRHVSAVVMSTGCHTVFLFYTEKKYFLFILYVLHVGRPSEAVLGLMERFWAIWKTCSLRCPLWSWDICVLAAVVGDSTCLIWQEMVAHISLDDR